MSYNRYFSPAQVESDQKDLIISQLKADVFELKKNEQEYMELNKDLKVLELKYRNSQEEKARLESELKAKHEEKIRTIAFLKTDIDTMKGSLKEKRLESDEIKSENLSLKELIDHRQHEANRIKKEYGLILEEIHKLEKDIESFDSQINQLKSERRNFIDDIELNSKNLDEALLRSKDLEKILREKELENSRSDKHNKQLQKSNETLLMESKNKESSLKYLSQQENESKRNLRGAEADLQQLHQINEKVKSEALQNNRNYQQEVLRGQDLDEKLLSLGNILKSREAEEHEYRKEVEAIKEDYSNNVHIKNQMENDLDELRKHIELLNSQNMELIEELEYYCEQDEKVRTILNRKSRVKSLRMKAENNNSKVYFSKTVRETVKNKSSGKKTYENTSKTTSPYRATSATKSSASPYRNK